MAPSPPVDDNKSIASIVYAVVSKRLVDEQKIDNKRIYPL